MFLYIKVTRHHFYKNKFIRFFHPHQWPMTSNFEGFLYQILSVTLFYSLILEKEPVFPFLMLSAK